MVLVKISIKIYRYRKEASGITLSSRTENRALRAQREKEVEKLLNKEIKVIASYKCRSRAHWNISTIWYLSEHQGLSTLKASIKPSVEQQSKKETKQVILKRIHFASKQIVSYQLSTLRTPTK